MAFTASSFVTLLQALNLSQSPSKPVLRLPLDPQGSLGSEGSTQPFSQHSSSSSIPGVVLDQLSGGNCSFQPYQAPNLGTTSFAPFDQGKATVFRYRQQQSVNLGSWFVHEQWMTPSLFTCAAGPQISELDIATGWNSSDSARAVLERHWDTFVQASDFQYLASIGINTVRLPIGYWNLGPDFCQGTPFEPVATVYQNSWGRVTNAINMAADVGIGVLVDLHGAPGSQNGQPHSGISDGQVNLFGNDWYENKTMAVLSFLMQEFVNVTNVVGIQILNEPRNVDELPDFYTRAIATMRQISAAAAKFPLYIHDGFNLQQYSDFVTNITSFVVEDHHSYFVFTPSDASESASSHVADLQNSTVSDLAEASGQRRNLVVDEFSCALTDQSLAGENDPEGARRQFCEGQMEIYQNETAGWAFWSYNKEDCTDDPGWCFKAAVGTSLPPTFFSYGNGSLADPSRIPALADLIAGMGLQSAASSYDMSASPSQDTSFAPSPTSNPNVGLFALRRRRPLRYERRPVSASVLRMRNDASQLPVDAGQRAIAKGYSDGFLTAKMFALYGMSKLGFTGQYISDSLEKLGSTVIEPGTEHFYEQWFMEGLHDGEALISSNVG